MPHNGRNDTCAGAAVVVRRRRVRVGWRWWACRVCLGLRVTGEVWTTHLHYHVLGCEVVVVSLCEVVVVVGICNKPAPYGPIGPPQFRP